MNISKGVGWRFSSDLGIDRGEFPNPTGLYERAGNVGIGLRVSLFRRLLPSVQGVSFVGGTSGGGAGKPEG